jgi:cellulose synthase/poly-beta-1,6-N-acetylglucosamine synthase-like glycosyltransferase
MRTLVEIILLSGGAVLLLPAAILLVEVLAALLPDAPAGGADPSPFPRSVILVPAHDEEGQIEATVRGLVADRPPGARILVIADNCSDQTAARAVAAGAEAIERHDTSQIGKGHAISFGLRHLDANPPEIVVLVDADCRVSAGGLSMLVRAAARSGRPIQAEYLIGAPRDSSPLVVIGALAILLRNRVRPRGLRRLGLPCHLTGSGMAFPWRVLRDAPDTGSILVEDLVMGIELALTGHPAESCPAVQISSELPEGRAAGLRQRRRWEHGQLHTLATYGPRLVAAGVLKGRLGLLGLGLDLLVPPLALLVMLQGGYLAVTVLAALVGLTSAAPAILAGVGLAMVGVAVMAAWAAYGRRTLPFRHLLFAPVYLAWKIPLYVALLIKGRQKSWERTARGAAARDEAAKPEAAKPETAKPETAASTSEPPKPPELGSP